MLRELEWVMLSLALQIRMNKNMEARISFNQQNVHVYANLSLSLSLTYAPYDNNNQFRVPATRKGDELIIILITAKPVSRQQQQVAVVNFDYNINNKL